MMTVASDGSAHLLLPSQRTVTRRQDAALAYDLATVAYVTSPGYIVSCGDVLAGRVRLVEIPRMRALDIDDELDLLVADLLVHYLKRSSG
jgi:N-acylneuraminate cytidylyltransferase